MHRFFGRKVCRIFLTFTFSLALMGAIAPIIHATSGSDAATLPGPQQGAVHGPALGEHLPLWSGLPFLGMLLSIALCPLLAPRFWHHHFGKVSAFWAAVLAIPFVAAYGAPAGQEIVHILLVDYVPFIILLWSLYTVSGGILLRGALAGTPAVNTLMLVVGTLLASWMGTTGAAMLMIRPFLRANRHRKNRTFMVVFFIFLVANVGGALTPLGDPPLFLGFLHGVPFFWTMRLLPHMATTSLVLLLIYYFLDRYHYRREGSPTVAESGAREPMRLEGLHNFLLLGAVVAAVLMSGLLDLGPTHLLGVHRPLQEYLRDILLVLIGLVSLLATRAEIRQDNDFSWGPILEVAILFVGIFITMIPCLLMLKAGASGALSFVIQGVQEPRHYFWIAGALSSFLDNAPTYLTFFNTALGRFFSGVPEAQAVARLIDEKAIFLQAIATGAVFFGACSYIGNAPNFMVRSIAEEAGTPMPSFFGYILKYTAVFLLPTFVLVTVLFF